MALSNELISQFVKVTKDTTEIKRETTVYGTIVEHDGSKYVRLDGSDLLTPISSTTDVEDKERVTVLIMNHTATVTGNISSPSARTETVKNIDNKVSDVETEVEDIKASTVEEFKAIRAEIDNLEVGNLSADVADIKTLMFGSASGDSIQSSFSNAVIAQVGSAQIKSAMIESLAASKISSGSIITNNVEVKSEDGRLLISDETIQIRDANRVRVQIGKDASGDYSINVWDANGKLMFSEGGITDSAIKNAIIRDNMISENANISGHKLNIDSLFEVINGSTKTINSSKIYLDGEKQTLDVAFESIATDMNNLSGTVSSQGTQLSVVQGQISSKIWQQDIDDSAESLSTKYSALEQTVDGLSTTVSTHTTQISNKADKSTVVAVDEKVSSLETNLSGFKTTVSSTYATKESLNDKADVSVTDALENNYSQLNTKHSTLSQTVEGLSVEVSEKVTQNDIDNSIDAIDEFHNTAVSINKDGIVMDTTGSIVAYVDDTLRLNIDETGVNAPLIAAENVQAPNLVQKNLTASIPWKGSIQASLDACPKWLTQTTTLTVPAGTYREDIVIRGFKGGTLQITFEQGVKINGSIGMQQCDSVYLAAGAIGHASIYPQEAITTVTAVNVGFLEMHNLQISGYRNRTSASVGSSSAISVTAGSAYIENCCVEYTKNYAILFYMGARGMVQDCFGGVNDGSYDTGANLGYGIYGSGSAHVAIYGKCPVAVTTAGEWLSTLLGGSLATPTEGGMEYVPPEEITQSFAISKHCTYVWAQHRLNDDQTELFSQGRYGEYASGDPGWRTGAMWFASATSALAGKTIVSATLTLRRYGGGTSQAVPVYLGSVALLEADFETTTSPTFTASTNNYPGAEISRGIDMTYDVTELMTAVQAGYAIAVKEPRNNYSGSSHSGAYTFFYGKGSAYEPVLTVTYK